MSDSEKFACFHLAKAEKNKIMLEEMQSLTAWHYQHCSAYQSLIDSYGGLTSFTSLSDIPPLTASLFKEYELKSIDDDQVFKVLSSSGTSSAKVSKIFLDKDTASFQSKALVKIIQSFLGKQRRPMILVESVQQASNRYAFSARVAGAQGLSLFGRQHCYILNDDMSLNLAAFQAFCEQYRQEPILIFGFTFMVWCHLLQELERLDLRVALPNATLIHSGGWKKMQEQEVDASAYKNKIFERLGIRSVHDFYGMVEQTGSIFMECEQGVLHCSDYSDILIRNLKNWQVCGVGEEGVIQVFSTLPKSYPGHNLLTEDRGVLLGEDSCQCGRQGKFFKVVGRVPKAEQRGCSDTYTEQNSQGRE